MTFDQARARLTCLEAAFESEHMGHPDFRVPNGIFATFQPTKNLVVLRLPIELCELLETEGRFRRMGRFGGMGWTGIDVGALEVDEFEGLARLAHQARMQPKKSSRT